MKRILRLLAIPWRWLRLNQLREERKERNRERFFRRFASNVERIDRETAARTKPRPVAFRMVDGVFVPFGHGDNSEGRTI